MEQTVQTHKHANIPSGMRAHTLTHKYRQLLNAADSEVIRFVPKGHLRSNKWIKADGKRHACTYINTIHTLNLLKHKTGSKFVRMKEIYKVQVLAEKTNPLPSSLLCRLNVSVVLKANLLYDLTVCCCE